MDASNHVQASGESFAVNKSASNLINRTELNDDFACKIVQGIFRRYADISPFMERY